jgi:hypothetical protein
MFKRVTLLGLLAVAVAAGVWVHQVLAAKESREVDSAAFEAVERAMAKLKIDDPIAFNDVLTAEGLPHNKTALEKLKTFREEAVQHIGKPLGQVELVCREKIGTSFVKYVYLERYEHSALVWAVTFYRDANAWRAAQLEWSAEFRNLFQKG